jgi:DNA-binding MarR family transcriptional regulator
MRPHLTLDGGMDETGARSRPIGWWLKEADARIDAAFDRALGPAGLDRRRWQLLASLSRGPADQGDLAGALRRFDDRADVDVVVGDLIDTGLVTREPDGRLALTAHGATIHARAAEEVAVVRERVAAALGTDGYVRLIELLGHLVTALDDR